MIQPQELRRGNLVTDEYYDSFKTIIEVDSINGKGINLSIASDGNWPELAHDWIEPDHKFEDLFGIPLTEERLLKAGFRKEKDAKYVGGILEAKACFYIRHPDFIFIKIILEHDGSWVLAAIDEECNHNIQHVHSLQNLYHAFTGEELEFKQ